MCEKTAEITQNSGQRTSPTSPAREEERKCQPAMSEGDAFLMPPPAPQPVMAPPSTTLMAPPPPATQSTPQPVATQQSTNGSPVDPSAPDRKTKKKNKKKEKRKEKRQQQAIDRKQSEDKLSVDPIHKARMEYEERMQQELEERERFEMEQKRKQWELREQEILAEIERKKQEEELKRLEAEEKKRQEAEEREVGLCTLCNILCLVLFVVEWLPVYFCII